MTLQSYRTFDVNHQKARIHAYPDNVGDGHVVLWLRFLALSSGP
ncbi:hypothetical protein GGI59_004771 [Rhizobium lentis]|uniref:Uncharacterized protein n=1 Tax=Rhizobium lentis TaxID=1138194 RepID=A0A7W8XHT5_9HYPH|nr:hypothetical protein [Rhizobium lentis]MBB5552310.1 hypothetical protein [Rhizobium lentis]MBB5563081.1 hypothetical protein [Rhizobium lentis]MBB5569127.1 hypothetical protein [Rhizobium lentis]